MATTLYNRTREGTLVGAVVYKHYTPAIAGRILEVVDAGGTTGLEVAMVRVKWQNPKHGTTVESTLSLADYEALVLDHERKAKNHRTTYEKIKGGK